jgi:hypothetical protein
MASVLTPTWLSLPVAHAKRLTWALKESGHLLVEALRKDTSRAAREVEKFPEDQIPARLVSLVLRKADPTLNKGMTAWLVKQYARGALRLEDLGTANETLMMFQRYAPRLGADQRDLGRYPHLAAVWEAVIGFANDEEQHLSGKAQKALDRDKAYAESRILQQNADGFTIAVPLTEFAAKWWGKGTRWCTAAEKDNQFHWYHAVAPLLVILVPGVKRIEKFQLWCPEEGEPQFMDASDQPVSPSTFETHWRFFEPVFLAAIRMYPMIFQSIPNKLWNTSLCMTAINRSGEKMAQSTFEEYCERVSDILESFPSTFFTDAICKSAISHDAWALRALPEFLRTPELYEMAVRKRGNVIQAIPCRNLTSGLCSLAVEQNGWFLKYVPTSKRSSKICAIAVKQSGLALMEVPEHLRTKIICDAAVKECGVALAYVPDSLKTRDLCEIAVRGDGLALSSVPAEFVTPEMCRLAVSQNGEALRYVPEELRRDELYHFEICRIAVAQNGAALDWVPDRSKTKELCGIAVAQNGYALKFTPERFKTEELCEIAVKGDYAALWFVPERLLTPRLFALSLEADSSSIESQLRSIQSARRTKEICELAVRHDGLMLEAVPKSKMTLRLCKLAVEQSGWALEFVPDRFKTKNLCEIAIRSTVPSLRKRAPFGAFHFVPKDLEDAIADLMPMPEPIWEMDLLDKMANDLVRMSSCEHGGPDAPSAALGSATPK